MSGQTSSSSAECCPMCMQEGVRTFSVRVGVRNVFWTCIALLEIAYAGAICVGFASQVSQQFSLLF